MIAKVLSKSVCIKFISQPPQKEIPTVQVLRPQLTDAYKPNYTFSHRPLLPALYIASITR